MQPAYKIGTAQVKIISHSGVSKRNIPMQPSNPAVRNCMNEILTPSLLEAKWSQSRMWTAKATAHRMT